MTTIARRTQAERVAQTRGALIGAARELFAEHGFAQVSLDQIAAQAGVTRGGLYHHFDDKIDVFRAVYTDVERECIARVAAVVGEITDTATDIAKAVTAYLDVCEDPEVKQIALLDAPVVLGWQEWRRIESDYSLGVMTARLELAVADGVRLVAGPQLLSSLILATAMEASLVVATAPDPIAARREAEAALTAFLHGVIEDPAQPKSRRRR